METIIVKPKNADQAKEVLNVLKKMKVKAEVYQDRTKEEILDSIERGAKEAAEYLKGKRKLRNIQDLLNEL
jgi:cell division protein FtsX